MITRLMTSKRSKPQQEFWDVAATKVPLKPSRSALHQT